MQRKFKLIKEYPNCPVDIDSEVVGEVRELFNEQGEQL